MQAKASRDRNICLKSRELNALVLCCILAPDGAPLLTVFLSLKLFYDLYQVIVPPKLTLDQINDILTILDGNIDLLSDKELHNYVNQITIGLPFQTLNFEKGFLYRGRQMKAMYFLLI